MGFCAACLDDRLPLVPRPLGRDGGIVLVCPNCDPGEPKPAKRRGRPVYRGYAVPERDTGRGSTRDRFTAGANRVAPSTTPRVRYSGNVASPGFVIVRVSRKRGNVPIDRDAARETLRGEPWFAEVRHVGSDVRFHIFERPDAELAKRVRSTPARFDGGNAMDALAVDVKRKAKR